MSRAQLFERFWSIFEFAGRAHLRVREPEGRGRPSSLLPRPRALGAGGVRDRQQGGRKARCDLQSWSSARKDRTGGEGGGLAKILQF